MGRTFRQNLWGTEGAWIYLTSDFKVITPLAKISQRLAIGSLDHMSPLKMDSTPTVLDPRIRIPNKNDRGLNLSLSAEVPILCQLPGTTTTGHHHQHLGISHCGVSVVLPLFSFCFLGWVDGKGPQNFGGWSSFGVLVIFFEKNPWRTQQKWESWK